ncbi:MAG: HAAS signaling domain-containing protein [Candidatus Dormibacteraceae bacterium]
MPDSKPANDVAGYADAVRAALASLPEKERESLLEDLESHLAEVASESDAPLQERLGTPEAYAAELKLAYGTSADAGETKPRGPKRERRTALIHAVTGTRAYREVRAMLPELRPGWWVLRGYLAILFLAFLFRGQDNLRPIPNPFHSLGLFQILATVAAIVVSVRLGRRGLPDNKAWRAAAAAANVAIVVLALPVLVSMGTSNGYTYYGGDPSGSYAPPVDASYYVPGVSNIYPYSSDGKPLKGVLLYDQDGRPLVIDTSGKGGGVTNVPVGSDGLPIPNAYPLDQRDVNGQPVLPPRVALPPSPTASPSATPTANPAATPKP